jgi:hypothetical protein
MPEAQGNHSGLADDAGSVANSAGHESDSSHRAVNHTLPTPGNDAMEETLAGQSSIAQSGDLQRSHTAPVLPLPCSSMDTYQAEQHPFLPSRDAFQYETDDLDLLWSNLDLDIGSASASMQFPIPFPQFASGMSQDFFDFPPGVLTGTDDFQDGETQDEEPYDPVASSGGSGPLSRYGSRLPSVQPENLYEHGEPMASMNSLGVDRPVPQEKTPNCPWRLTRPQYDQVVANVLEQSSILPSAYTLPSRHALNRYVEGYFTGFHEHLPFLHVPTISMTSSRPELVLAIAATGAMYRFEEDRSRQLYSLAKLLADDRLHRYRDSSFSAETGSEDLSGSSLYEKCPHNQGSHVGHIGYDATERSRLAAEQCQQCSKLQLMQALLLLIALSTWSARPLLKDAFAMASQLAVLVREIGWSDHLYPQDEANWESWVPAESSRRIRFVAYCFFGLHVIAYNVPPKILSNELRDIILPCHEDRWRAVDEQQWNRSRSQDNTKVPTLHSACSALFNPIARSSAGHSLSSFANYVLAHSILQQLFFSRQSLTDFEQNATGSLPDETLYKFERALRRWQYNWEGTKDSSIDPSSPDGPLAFNSTALLRVAYIRLHANLGPYRQLDTGDPHRIATAMNVVAPMARSPQMCRAVLQTVHTLSIPVRVGIPFVARTRTLKWSVVHSLCNLECAMFLSRWLNYRGAQMAEGVPLDENERRLTNLVQSLLDEAFVGDATRQETNIPKRFRMMAAAVVRLWADTFQGAHVFGLFAGIGEALVLYAAMLDHQLDSTM